MTSKDVYESARVFTFPHIHKFENTFVHKWEADVFSVTSSGYSYEIEIKISRSDFLADFKKQKHHFLVKKAPFLHKDPFDCKEMLFDKYYWLSREQRIKISELENKVRFLEKKEVIK